MEPTSHKPRGAFLRNGEFSRKGRPLGFRSTSQRCYTRQEQDAPLAVPPPPPTTTTPPRPRPAAARSIDGASAGRWGSDRPTPPQLRSMQKRAPASDKVERISNPVRRGKDLRLSHNPPCNPLCDNNPKSR
jgi:hypothetical protein